MNTERIEEIMSATAYPESHSVHTALMQVWNEVTQEYQQENEQLKARVAEFESVVERLIEWNEKYPSHRIFSHGEIIKIASEMELINKKSKEIICRSPQQSLASIQADYANQLATEVYNQFNKWGKAQIWLNEKAEQLRNSKDGK